MQFAATASTAQPPARALKCLVFALLAMTGTVCATDTWTGETPAWAALAGR